MAYLKNNGYAISYCMKAKGGMSQVFKNQIQGRIQDFF